MEKRPQLFTTLIPEVWKKVVILSKELNQNQPNQTTPPTLSPKHIPLCPKTPVWGSFFYTTPKDLLLKII